MWRSFRSGLALVILVPALAAQVGLNDAAQRLRATTDPSPESRAAFHLALLQWVESRLPETTEATIQSELKAAALAAPDDFQGGYGFVDRVKLIRPAEAPDLLIVLAGVTLPCGVEDRVYVYSYEGNTRKNVLRSSGSQQHEESVSDVVVSAPDAAGNRLMLIKRLSAQCGSFSYQMSFELVRLSSNSSQGQSLFTGTHQFWFGEEEPVRLTADEMLLELEGDSIAADIGRRTHVLRYRASAQSAERMDPVALLPQDFVDEWLTRPWSEMKSRSAVPDDLKKWHEALQPSLSSANFRFVQQCSERPNEVQIALDLTPRPAYFLVKGLPDHVYQMVDVSFTRQDGCPGESPASTEKK
jgi:hypothetical protein